VTPAASPAPAKIVVAANSSWNLLNFRGGLIEGLTDAGFSVVALAPDDGSSAGLTALGAQFVPIRIDNSGTSIVRDARLLGDYWRILRRLRPQAFLGFTVKPNIYGSLAAGLLGVRTINNISGLGTAFMGPGPLNWLVSRLYRLALARSHRVFFQNPADLELFVARGLVRIRQAQRIPGSGVDLGRFQPSVAPRPDDRPFRFLFVGRLLRDKGLVEYAEAARRLRPRWPQAEFAILGFAGSDNRSAVPIAEVERWRDEGIVTYLGETGDVRPQLEAADCVVLPSYREGLPRSLLEAAAMAKPMVATDVPGCRDVIADGENGFLCQARSPESLAVAMEKMLGLKPAERVAMGRRARQRAEREFDQARVVSAYLEALR
jgi:glycosyltransferase involved in cell wall biosynthesis